MNKKFFKRYITVALISIFIFVILYIIDFLHNCRGEDCVACKVLGFLNATVTVFSLLFNLSFIAYNVYGLIKFFKPKAKIKLKEIQIRCVILKNTIIKVRKDLVFLKVKFQ